MEDQPPDPVDDYPRGQDEEKQFCDGFGNVVRPDAQPAGGRQGG